MNEAYFRRTLTALKSFHLFEVTANKAFTTSETTCIDRSLFLLPV